MARRTHIFINKRLMLNVDCTSHSRKPPRMLLVVHVELGLCSREKAFTNDHGCYTSRDTFSGIQQ